MKRLRVTCGMTAALFCLSAGSAFAGKSVPLGSEAAPRSSVGAFIVSVNPGLAPDLADRYAEQALRAAHDAKIDPCLLLAIVSVESHWKADAVSRHGAIGLGQLKPATADSVKADPFSPSENLHGTSRYLRLLLDRFKGGATGTSAIAAYNAGPGAVSRNGGRAPNRDAESYVGKVLARLEQVRRVVGAKLGVDADASAGGNAASAQPLDAGDATAGATENSAAAKLAKSTLKKIAPAKSAARVIIAKLIKPVTLAQSAPHSANVKTASNADPIAKTASKNAASVTKTADTAKRSVVKKSQQPELRVAFGPSVKSAKRPQEFEFWNIPDRTLGQAHVSIGPRVSAEPHALPAHPAATAADFQTPSMLTHNPGTLNRNAFLIQLRRVEP